jgi:hypothetical protein
MESGLPANIKTAMLTELEAPGWRVHMLPRFHVDVSERQFNSVNSQLKQLVPRQRHSLSI